ncbi:MAG: hypothetical protein QOC96_3680 [Acidobacteriota bacterium]|jgi:hypothetical protein|nr:hypothetical protein [Acidobacteriota bacterium]
MAGEELARRIVEKELKRTVVINDDNSAPGMYDLRIGSADAPEIAIECVGAVDPVFTETWNIGPARGPLELSITGDWIIEIAPNAKVNIIRQRIEGVIQALEGRAIYNVHMDHWLKWDDVALLDDLESLKITYAYCYRRLGTGKVYLTMPGMGGAVDEHGSALPEWTSEFLRAPAQKDVLCKLQRSGAANRHVFVIVSFAGATWPVESYLTSEFNHLPSHAPDLPTPVTGVWVISGMGKRGLRWDGVSWQLFDARGEGIDS